MEILKDVIKSINDAITFLEKTKIDKKQKSEKETLINNLKQLISRCEKKVRGEVEEQNYDDVGTKKPIADDVYDDVQGSNYDDLGTAPANSAPETDGIYDDNAADNAGETYDDVGQQPRQIEPIACDKLIRPTLAEFVDFKKDGTLKNLLKGSWQKRWCVLKGNIFYLYETATDKQQKDAFDVTGYTFQVRDDITKEAKRKGRCFELKNDEKTYEFCASDKESMAKWQALLRTKVKRGPDSSSLSGSTNETYDDVGTQPTEQNESMKNKKKGLFSKWTKKTEKSPSKAAETIESESTYDDTAAQNPGDIYEETGDGHYDDTGRMGGGENYDDVGRMRGGETYDDCSAQTYDDTGTTLPLPPPSIQTEGGDFYEEYEGEKQEQLPLPPVPSPMNKQRRQSARDDLPPLPASPKPPAGFPTLPARNETGSASGTFLNKRPPMPLPGEPTASSKGALPPPPPMLETNGRPRSTSPSLPPPMSDDSFSVDSLEPFGDDNEDYENMYQGMWDCHPDEENELKFKREEIVHIISREYDNYGWWTAESSDGNVGLVPVSYLMKAYDI